jgi:hypothetical protein
LAPVAVVAGAGGLGGCREFGHPGPAEEYVAQDGQGVAAVLDRGGEVAADGVAVASAVFAGESPGDVLLALAGP